MTTQNITYTEDGRTFIDMPTNDQNPCLDCGACCAHFRISFYSGEMDTQPLGFVPSNLVSKINDTMACMTGTEYGHGKCIALDGEIGKQISCKIYANRPTPCREYPVWLDDGTANPKCNELRFKIGLPPIKNM